MEVGLVKVGALRRFCLPLALLSTIDYGFVPGVTGCDARGSCQAVQLTSDLDDALEDEAMILLQRRGAYSIGPRQSLQSVETAADASDGNSSGPSAAFLSSSLASTPAPVPGEPTVLQDAATAEHSFSQTSRGAASIGDVDAGVVAPGTSSSNASPGGATAHPDASQERSKERSTAVNGLVGEWISLPRRTKPAAAMEAEPLRDGHQSPEAKLAILAQFGTTIVEGAVGKDKSNIVPFIVVALAVLVCSIASYHACTAAIFKDDAAPARSSGQQARANFWGRAPLASKMDLRPGTQVGGFPASQASLMPHGSLRSLASVPPPLTPGGYPRPSLSVLSVPPPPSQPYLPQTPGGKPGWEALKSPPTDRVLCPAMVLKNTEGHLEIPLPQLLASRGGGDFPIMGPLGKPWGRGSVRNSEDSGQRRRFELLVANPGGDGMVPMGNIVQSAHSDGLEVTPANFGGDSAQPTFARLRRRNDGAYEVVRKEGQPALVFLSGDLGNLLLRASAGETGRPLASASRGALRRNPATGSSVEHFELRMQREVDTVLLVMCMLGVVIFLQP